MLGLIGETTMSSAAQNYLLDADEPRDHIKCRGTRVRAVPSVAQTLHTRWALTGVWVVHAATVENVHGSTAGLMAAR